MTNQNTTPQVPGGCPEMKPGTELICDDLAAGHDGSHYAIDAVDHQHDWDTPDPAPQTPEVRLAELEAELKTVEDEILGGTLHLKEHHQANRQRLLQHVRNFKECMELTAAYSARLCARCGKPSGGGDLCPACELHLQGYPLCGVDECHDCNQPTVAQVPAEAFLTPEDLKTVVEKHDIGDTGLKYWSPTDVADAATKKALAYESARTKAVVDAAQLAFNIIDLALTTPPAEQRTNEMIAARKEAREALRAALESMEGN